MINEEKYNKSLSDNISGYEINRNLNTLKYQIIKSQAKYKIYTKSKVSYYNSINKENIIKDHISDLSNILFIFLSAILINNNNISLGNFILFT